MFFVVFSMCSLAQSCSLSNMCTTISIYKRTNLIFCCLINSIHFCSLWYHSWLRSPVKLFAFWLLVSKSNYFRGGLHDPSFCYHNYFNFLDLALLRKKKDKTLTLLFFLYDKPPLKWGPNPVAATFSRMYFFNQFTNTINTLFFLLKCNFDHPIFKMVNFWYPYF